MFKTGKMRIRSGFREYEVRIVDDFTTRLKEHMREDVFLVIDKKVAQMYMNRLQPIDNTDRIVEIEAIEQNKTVTYCEQVIESLVKVGVRRTSTLVVLGGGITQDIGGFLSSILFRGINWVFYPTTLLAQADSCIGSKTSINLGRYKNLLGSFYPPSEIIIDMSVLNTLSAGDVRSGIGEMLHYFLVAGDSLAGDISQQINEVMINRSLLQKYIMRSLGIKKEVIEIDEYDTGRRNLFNYGHTFGHAIETLSEYRVNHGQAVTMGMDIANYISQDLGMLDGETFTWMHGILQLNMPDFRLQHGKIDAYFDALGKDKKNRDGNLGCILTSGPGHMKKVEIPLDGKFRGLVLSYFEGLGNQEKGVNAN